MAYAKHDAESLGQIIQQLHGVIGTLKGVVETLEQHSVDKIEVQYQREMLRAMKGLNSFATSAINESKQELYDRGLLEAKPSPTVEKKKAGRR